MSSPALPAAVEWLWSGVFVVLSYLAARGLSYLIGRVVLQAARNTPTSFDDRLAAALRRPLTYGLFLLGVYASLHRIPLHPEWSQRLDLGLFAAGALAIALALVRAWDIALDWYSNDKGGDPGLTREFAPLVSKLGKLFIVVLMASVTLKHFGVDVDSVVVSLGVGSLAVGMAAKDTLTNMIAGFTLLLDRPFATGDRLRLASGDVGDVLAIGLRSTALKTTDETVLVIPNSVLVNERVTNLSRPTRAATARLEVSIARDTDIARALAELTAAVGECPLVDTERPIAALVTRLGEAGPQLQATFWVRDFTEQGAAVSQAYQALARRFAAAAIEIPYPVRRLIHVGPAAGDGAHDLGARA